ncbi:HNH endonuclease [Rhodococcus sp. NPDC058521]|uniref:HNH endonuclease n=1 Tax=Rhodococcus sp. NPDC058521 TaxID=3346536 RepID=UPI00364C539D
MTSWIVKISGKTPQHWDFARDDQFWDVRDAGSFRRIEPGDDIFFWLTGKRIFLSWVRATSSLYAIGDNARRAHWVDVDTGGYTHRFEFELVSEDVAHPAAWNELQAAAGRKYSPQAPANPVNEPKAQQFLRTRFGHHGDIAFPNIPVTYKLGDDMRERARRQITVRRGQSRFRADLMDAYAGTCAVTGSTVTSVLEAAHIDRYFGDHTNHVANGLLLRSDIHTLFDLGVLTVSSSLTIQLAPWLQDSEYGDYHDQPLRLPSEPHKRPASDALERHRHNCQWL